MKYNSQTSQSIIQKKATTKLALYIQNGGDHRTRSNLMIDLGTYLCISKKHHHQFFALTLTSPIFEVNCCSLILFLFHKHKAIVEKKATLKIVPIT